MSDKVNDMKKILIVCSSFLMTGCLNIGDNSDLKKKIDDTVKNAYFEPKEIVPPEDPVEFVYSASSYRSPFQAERALLPIRENEANSIFPIENRIPEPLEKVRFENISMVGTLEDEEGNLIALIRVSASEGLNGVHPVNVGDYLGLNNGRIISLHPSHIALNEIVSQGKNSWQNRARTIQLINQ